MARDFDGSASRLTNATSPVADNNTAFTLSAWVRYEAAPFWDLREIIGFYDSADTSSKAFYMGFIANANVDWKLRFTQRTEFATSDTCDTTNAAGTGWNHCCIREATEGGGDDQICVLNGDWASRGSMAHMDRAVDSIDATVIGSHGDTGVGEWWDGQIAHVAVWTAALTQYEIEALADGAHPFTIRPESLVRYWPLDATNYAQDLVGRAELTNTSTASTQLAPPVKWAARALLNTFSAAAAAATSLFARRAFPRSVLRM